MSFSSSSARYFLDRVFYEKVRAGQREVLDRFVLPPLTGRGFIVRKGESFRVIEEAGPQVGDVALWNLQNPRETLSCLRTWEVEGWFIEPYRRLWSDLPSFRPMATCLEETADSARGGEGFHHHSVASHCSPENTEMLTGRPGLSACRLNLLRAIEPFGLTEEDLRDNIDVFTPLTIDPESGKLHGAICRAAIGAYIEFYAEMDLLVAASVCPAGDLSMLQSTNVLPLAVEVRGRPS